VQDANFRRNISTYRNKKRYAELYISHKSDLYGHFPVFSYFFYRFKSIHMERKLFYLIQQINDKK